MCDLAKGILGRLGEEYPLVGDRGRSRSDEGRRLAATPAWCSPRASSSTGSPFSYGRLSERKLRRLLDRRAAMR